MKRTTFLSFIFAIFLLHLAGCTLRVPERMLYRGKIVPFVDGAGDPVQILHFDRASSINVMSEIMFFPGGGGGLTICPEDSEHVPYFYWATSEELSTWLNLLEIDTCGWVPHESVSLTVFFGSATVKSEEMEADEFGGVFVEFLLEPENAPGEYRFLFRGNSGELRGKMQVLPSPTPALYHFFDRDKVDTKKLLLYGFQPGEEVWLVAYQGLGPPDYVDQLAGMSKVRVRDDGTLFVQSSLTSKDGDDLPVFYAAIGEKSGEAVSVRRFESIGLSKPVSKVHVP